MLITSRLSVRRFLAGRAKAICFMATKPGLIKRLAGDEDGLGILLECCLVCALRRFHERLDVSPKVRGMRDRPAIFFEAARAQNEVSGFG